MMWPELLDEFAACEWFLRCTSPCARSVGTPNHCNVQPKAPSMKLRVRSSCGLSKISEV